MSLSRNRFLFRAEGLKAGRDERAIRPEEIADASASPSSCEKALRLADRAFS